MSNLSIDEAIAAAKSAAAGAPAQANAALAGGAAVAPYVAPSTPAVRGPALGLDDIMTGSMSVASWLKVNEFGLLVGTDRKLFESLTLAIRMSEIAYCYSIRYGNPAIYEKTYDHSTNVKGGSWADTVMRAQRIDPKASEFRSADIPFYVLENIVKQDGSVNVEAGKQIGHSLSVTGWKAFQSFVLDAKAKGWDLQNGLFQIKVGFDVQKNTKGTWGVLRFEDVTPITALPWEVN